MKYDLIRKLRKANKLTLVELGEKTGYTPSFLSQIERGLKEPSLEAMRKIANALDTTVIALLEDDNTSTAERANENGAYAIIRSNNRRKFTIDDIPGYELITPQTADSSQKYAMYGLISTLKPNEWSNKQLIRHAFEECCYIIRGKMKAFIGDESCLLSTGDSFYIKGFVPHNYLNVGDEDLVILAFQSKM
ncbi:helix-turn-helix domain-containing protein [Fusibacter ferrireducens]|uniref:Helix-turn-helix domain-containing protein n=1 Tax=Fusibacter ferrireducens TaxID=2785058 RepID=A0ABR9ZPJ5_9FIRM|nr:XRE family transcriptional regulator [Fusibacter ferrireducens]MBF4692334.1 helix-turn-helix domain-containing protein [Fusibacter ferrireducens]